MTSKPAAASGAMLRHQIRVVRDRPLAASTSGTPPMYSRTSREGERRWETAAVWTLNLRGSVLAGCGLG